MQKRNEITLQDVLWSLRRRWKWVVLFSLLCGLAAGLGTHFFITPLYTTQASMCVFSSRREESGVTNSQLSADAAIARTYSILLTSQPVTQAVSERLGGEAAPSQIRSMLSTEVDAQIIYVRVTCADPALAVRVANALSDVAPATLSSLVRAGEMVAVDRAVLPRAPASPSLPVNVLLGLLIGLLLSCGAVLVRTLLDTTVWREEDVERSFDLPLLGSVPCLTAEDEPSRRRKKTALAERPRLTPDSSFAITEAYNSIRTRLMFTGKGEKCPVFAVSSALAADGKTVNAVSLAVSIAAAGQRVLLIDGDLRKPAIHRYFGVECRGGLSELLAGLTKDVSIRQTDCEGLFLLTAGQTPPNPAELLGNPQMDSLLAFARKQFDYVLIDTPPAGIVTDASVLAEKVTGYVFVVRSGRSRLREVNGAVRQICQMNGRIAGFVLNDPENRVETRYAYAGRAYGGRRAL